MAVTMLPLDSTAGSPSFSAQATRQAFSVLAGPAPAGRPLGARSGVRAGTPTSTATLSGAGSTTWNMAAHAGVLDTQTGAAAGPYFYATDGADTGSITAANATNPRIDILYVKVNDNPQDGSGLYSGQILYLAGTAAGSPVQPATPARGMAIARINVPTSGGGSPTITWIAPTFTSESTYSQTGTGTVTGTSVASGNNQFSGVTFPIPFAASTVPSVQLTIKDGVTGANYLVPRAQSVSNTGFLLTLTNVGASAATWVSQTVTWTATGTL